MEPPSEMVHWLFGTGVLLLGLIMLAEAIVGRRGLGAAGPGGSTSGRGSPSGSASLMWPVMTFFTNSAIHMVAHGAWAQALMVMGAAELGLAQGKLHEPLVEARDADRHRRLGRRVPRARAERAGSSRARRSCTTCIGWTLVGRRARSRSRSSSGRARSCCSPASRSSSIALSVMLFSDRDLAPVFGHLSPLAGPPHR